MSATEYRVLGWSMRDRAEVVLGTTPSHVEALVWAEQARMDGYLGVRIEAAEGEADPA